jgi:hypothetical protein
LAVDWNYLSVSPQALELIEAAQRWVKDVDYDINVVEECPASLWHTLDVMDWSTFILEFRHHVIGNRSNVRVGRPTGDHEEVGEIDDTL